MKPSEQVLAALDYMREHGWYQGSAFAPDSEAACMHGANARTNGHGLFAEEAAEALTSAIRELFPACSLTGAITLFNDDPRTTFEDVELVMKHAAYDLESRGL